MAIDTNWLAEVLALAQSCEDIARGALGVGQRLLRAKDITQDEFDQLFRDYSLAMQKSRDMYYQASHGLVQQITSSTDLKSLAAETAELNRSLATLQKTQHVLTISLNVVALVGAVAGVITAPGAASVEAAYSAAKTVKQVISG
jgi:hypothetical protein